MTEYHCAPMTFFFSHQSHLGSQHPSVPFANSVNLTQPVFLIYPDMWGVKTQSQTGRACKRGMHIFFVCHAGGVNCSSSVPQLPGFLAKIWPQLHNCHSCNPCLVDKAGHGDARGPKVSKAQVFPKWTPDSWGGIQPGVGAVVG